jgi:hypothetical protein
MVGSELSKKKKSLQGIFILISIYFLFLFLIIEGENVLQTAVYFMLLKLAYRITTII